MPHDGHIHTHPHDHNHASHAEHLHSHPNKPSGLNNSDQVQDWIDNFIAGFRAAPDKPGFLRLARVPFELDGGDGAATLKLVDVTIEDAFQVATASPAFASVELVYHPYPAHMVRQRTDMRFVYVSLQHGRDIMLAEMAGLIEG